jgi:GNAT superfamily N-acetyltransferase
MDWQVHYANHRITPDLLHDYLWLQRSYEQAQAEFKRTTPPIRRLQKLIKDHCVPARVSSWRFLENVWVWENAVIFELERAWWADVPGSGNWLAYLRRMYVLDSKRGCGYGSRFIASLLEWAEESAAAISLISLLFGLSRNAHDKGPFFLESVEDVLGVWETGEIHRIVGGEWLRDWYSRKGFSRIRLLDGDFFNFNPSIPHCDQLVFLPASLDGAAKLAASHRLAYEAAADSSEEEASTLIASASGAADGIHV